MKKFCLLVILILSPASLAGQTWLVDGNGQGDFTDIQAAIDQALPGDVILVRPLATWYPGFTLGKQVMIQSETPGSRYWSEGPVAITGINSGRAGILGLEMGSSVLEIMDCAGEIFLEDVLLFNYSSVLRPVDTHSKLRIIRSSNVNLSRVEVNLQFYSYTEAMLDGPGAWIEDSVVKAHAFRAEGRDGDDGWAGGPGEPGGDALGLWRSEMVLAGSSSILGGDGGDASWDSWCQCGGDAGWGGKAISLNHDSRIWILGEGNQIVQGGMGGSRHLDAFCGSGGAGLDLRDPGSRAFVSRTALVGGAGGSDCQDGPDFSGNVTLDDNPPLLTLSGNLTVGGPVTMALDGNYPGVVLFLVSDAGGWAPGGIPNYAGPPLGVISGSWGLTYLAFPVGADGDFSLNGTIPDVPGFLGVPLVIQAALHGGSGLNYLSNPAMGVIGN